MTRTLEVRAHLDQTLLSCAALGPREARWPSSLARVGAMIVGGGALLLIPLGEPAVGGISLLIAAALVVLGQRADPACVVLPFAVRRGIAGPELCWPASLEGELEEPAGWIPLSTVRDSGRAQIVDERCVFPITMTPLHVQTGGLRLEIETVSAPDPLPRGRRPDPERRALLGFAAGSIVLHGSVVALALAFPLPFPISSGGGRDQAVPRTLRRLAMVAMPESNHFGRSGPLQLWLSSGGESTGRRPTGDRARPRPNLHGLRGPLDNPDPHLARRLAETAAQTAGVLGVLRSSNGSAGGARLAETLASLGNDLDPLLANLIGEGYGGGEAYGVGGLGLIGMGRGGGGNGRGSVLSGSLGTLGRGGGGGGGGAGYGRGVGRFSGRTARSCGDDDLGCIGAGRAEVRGTLDKETIRRHVRRHINEVRYCFVKELQLYPNGLDGRVSIQFEIRPDGTVSSSRVAASTLGVPAIESCVASAPRRWRFPKPRGGGVAEVIYPFYFRTAGGR